MRWMTPGRCVGVLMLAMAAGSVGCGQKKVEQAPPAPSAPAMTGPGYLRQTIGSLVRVRDFQPQMVGGYGLVVLPEGSGTGSSFVPAWLRQEMINRMRKQGMGSSRLGTENLSPLAWLANPDTVIVEVFGYVPPGAVAGAPFDVVIKALDEDTDATSLAGGTLWTTELSPRGLNRANLFDKPLAQAHGSAYINPFDDRPDDQRRYDFRRRALVIAGGKATVTRPVQLLLNQPSWSNSRLIADRINDSFSLTTDRRLVAEAQTDLLINLNIPDRFASDPARLIELILHTYVPHGGGFEAQQADRLARLMAQNPQDAAMARDVTLCWQAMGRAATPALREHYASDQPALRLAALEAGAWLGDERAGEPLAELTRGQDPATRIAAAEALVHLPRNIDAFAALKALLDDDDPRVRIAAYETLAANADPLIGRVMVEDERGLKFIIDRVPASRPLVYVTPRGYPRVAVFQPEMELAAPMLASLWDSRLLVRRDGADQALEVYYRHAAGLEPRTLKAEPMVATLAYLMGHHPTQENPTQGLDLTFGQVADALYTLCRDGTIDAPIEVRASPLARLVEEYPTQPQDPQIRPETGPPGSPAPGSSNPGSSEVPVSAPAADPRIDPAVEAAPALVPGDG